MSSLLLIFDDGERRLPEQDPHYLWMDASVLKVSTNPPDFKACLGHFVSEFGTWRFHNGPAECPPELRINGRPVDGEDVELVADRAEVRLSAEPYSEPPPRNWSTGPIAGDSPGAPSGPPPGGAGRYVVVPPGTPAGPDAQIVVDAPGVVPGHAWVEMDSRGAWWITAGNGDLYVNGEPVTSAVREPGTQFTVGQQVITVPSPNSRGRGRGLSIECAELSARRGGQPLLGNVSLSVAAGKFVAVFSPNPNATQMLLGLMVGGYRADHGAVRIGGSSRKGNPAVRWVPATDDLHRLLTVRETLAGSDDDRLDEMLTWVGLTTEADRQVRALDDGDRKRLSIACELMLRPALLVVFESAGAYAVSSDRDLMSRLGTIGHDTGCTIVVAARAVGNFDLTGAVVVLDRRGRLRYAGEPGEPFGDRHNVTRAEWLATLEVPADDPATSRDESLVRLPAMRAPLGTAGPFDGLATMVWQRALLFRRRGNGVLLGLSALAVVGSLAVFVSYAMAVPAIVAIAAITALVTGGTDLATARPVAARQRRSGVGTAAMVFAQIGVHGAVCAVLAAPMALWADLHGMVLLDLPGPTTWFSLYLSVWLVMVLSLSTGTLASAALPSDRLTPTNALVAGVLGGVLAIAVGWLLFSLTWAVGLPALLLLSLGGAGAASTVLQSRLS